MNRNHHNQRQYHDRQRHDDNNDDGPTAGRELAPDDPFLPLKVPPVAQQQDGDADDEERRAERPADVPQRVLVDVVARVREGDVEAEELRHGDADGGEGE
jgi:hypothetical protein